MQRSPTVVDLSQPLNVGPSSWCQRVASLSQMGPVAWVFGTEVSLRGLTAAEVQRLQAQGNWAQNWADLRVHPAFDPRRVWNCRFHRTVVLGAFRGALRIDGTLVPTGLYGAQISNCIIGSDTLIQDVSLLSDCVVGPQAVLFRCATVSGCGTTSFGNGQRAAIGPATGGRDVRLYAEQTVEELKAVLASSRAFREEYGRSVEQYARFVALPYTVVEGGAQLRRCGLVRGAYIGPCAVVDGVLELSEATVLSDRDTVTRLGPGVVARQVLVQWGAEISDLAVVEQSLIAEAAQIGAGAKVKTSVIGPNSTVIRGEVTSSLLGPFTSLNHEALLIATVWPEGKGNVSAGAKVGSNHTGKAPDQELWAGEGVFFGLGTLVKFPCNLTRAPYSLIASGALVAPQKLGYPFSLVVPPRQRPNEMMDGYNELLPGWMLYDAPYALVRNEMKFSSRNRARRHLVDPRVFRREIMAMVWEAAQRLEELGRTPKPYYTDADDPWVGKNYLTEAGRQRGLQAYRQWIRWWALRELWDCVQKELADDRLYPGAEVTASEDLRWALEQGFLQSSCLRGDGLVGAVSEFLELSRSLAVQIEQSKSRDDRRGAQIIPDYAEVQPSPPEDTVIRAWWDQTHRLGEEIRSVLPLLNGNGSVASVSHRTAPSPGD
jgi:carbonic anhydrase/acetyltransferase-like protein (isoleucine patch superfamily)